MILDLISNTTGCILLLNHLLVCNAAFLIRVVQQTHESQQEHSFSENGGKQPMYKICTCKLKSIFGFDFVNLHHKSVQNCLECCILFE